MSNPHVPPIMLEFDTGDIERRMIDSINPPVQSAIQRASQSIEEFGRRMAALGGSVAVGTGRSLRYEASRIITLDSLEGSANYVSFGRNPPPVFKPTPLQKAIGASQRVVTAKHAPIDKYTNEQAMRDAEKHLAEGVVKDLRSKVNSYRNRLVDVKGERDMLLERSKYLGEALKTMTAKYNDQKHETKTLKESVASMRGERIKQRAVVRRSRHGS